MRAADLLVQTLERCGVKYLFSLSGNQIMPVYDACIDSEIQIIHVRHESAAVHMADAWGRLTGQPGVALIAGGPGFANGLSASYVAQMAESPAVILSGHAPISTAGRMAFQEIDQVSPALAVAKNAYVIKEPELIGVEVEWGFKLATEGRPGPVHISLPQDLLSVEVDESKITSPSPKDMALTSEPDSGFLDRLRHKLGEAERPLLLAGPAVLRHPAFKPYQAALAKVGIPLVGMESPRGFDDPAGGTFGEQISNADLLVLLGKKIDFTLKLGEAPFIQSGTNVIQVDHEQAVLDLTRRNGENLQLLEAVQGDPSQIIEHLAQPPKGEIEKDRDWFKTVQASRQYRPAEWDVLTGDNEGLHPVAVGRAINHYLADADQSIFISDGGEFGQWMQATVQSSYRIINGKSGSIGNALPFALAARLAYPNAKIVACCGDGGFGFVPFEFDTAARYDIPFTLVIGNDACWGAEYQIQLRNYGADRVYETDLEPTRYDRVVEILGGWGANPADLASFEESLQAAGESGLPACINVPIHSVPAPKLVS